MFKIHLQLLVWCSYKQNLLWNQFQEWSGIMYFPLFSVWMVKLPFLHNLLPLSHLGSNLLSSTNLLIHLLISVSLCKSQASQYTIISNILLGFIELRAFSSLSSSPLFEQLNSHLAAESHHCEHNGRVKHRYRHFTIPFSVNCSWC